MESNHPQHETSHAILAALKGQHIERLEAEIGRLQIINKSLREQCTRAMEQLYQAEHTLKSAGLSDINHYRTMLKSMQAENARLTAALAQYVTENEWRNEAGQSVKERFDLP